MSSDYVTFNTLTVGLGEDAGGSESLGPPPQPLPILARVPRAKGVKWRLDTPRGAVSSEELASFEVTTNQPTAVAANPTNLPAERRPDKRPDTVPPAVSERPRTPEPTRASMAIEPIDEGWAAALLKMQGGGRATHKLLTWALLVAIAGTSLLLFRSAVRSGSDAPVDAGPAPAWTPAPLAGPAPLFLPADDTPQGDAAPGIQAALPSAIADSTPVAPIDCPALAGPTAIGPVGMAGKTRKPRQEPPAAPQRLASLPSPYPSTGLAPQSPSGRPSGTGNGPSAQLLGVRPYEQPNSVKQPLNPSVPSRNEQDRPGLY